MVQTKKTSPRPASWIGMLAPAAPRPAAPRYFFVHCAADDIDQVAPLIESAEADGHLFWLPHRHPRTGAEIAAAAEASTALLVFLSSSPVAEDVIVRAAAVRKAVVPVVLGDGAVPVALRHHVSTHGVIDVREPDGLLAFRRVLDQLAGPRRRSATAAPVVATPNVPEPTASLVPETPAAHALAPTGPPLRSVQYRASLDPAVVEPQPQRRRISIAQNFINAFAAGALALFLFAIIQLTGGPLTKGEIEDAADGVRGVAEAAATPT